MSTITKLNYTNETKDLIKDSLNQFGAGITDENTFRSYVDVIENIYSNWPTVTGTGSDINLTPTKKAKMYINLKGDTSQDSTEGKNKITFDNLSDGVVLGITKTFKNSEMSLNGTSTNAGQIVNNGTPFNITLEPGTYTYSVNKKSGSATIESSNDIAFILKTANNETLATIVLSSIVNAGHSQRTFTITETTDLYFYVYCNNSGIVINNLLMQFQLEQGSTATDYEPYTGGQASPNPDYPQPIKVVTGNQSITIANSDNTQSQTYPVSLRNMELCKIGDYQDYIYKSNGKWYKHNLIKKILLNGNENWRKATTQRPSFLVDNLNDKLSGTDNFYSDNFKYKGNAQSSTLGYAMSFNTGQYSAYLYIQVPDTVIQAEDTTGFKTWLSTHNTTVYYPLIEAAITDIEITDTTLINQLNAIEKAQSYDDQTNISAAGELPFIITAEALKKGGN